MTYFLRTLLSLFGAFLGDRRAGISTLVGGGIVVMVGALGLATDAARGYMVKARLSQALDAAALAGGRAMFSPTRDAQIQMFFQANFPPGFMGANVTGPNINVNSDSTVISLDATAQIDTTFMRVLGFQTLNVGSATEVTRETQYTDIIIAMDMSGSMSWGAPGGGSRIQAARNAATELINILFGSDETKELLKIGLVPWSGKVNVMYDGTTFDPALSTTQTVPAFTNPLTGTTQTTLHFANNSPVPLLEAPPSDWQGCVYSRYIDNADTTDDADTTLYDLSFTGGDWIAWEPIGPEGEPVPGSAVCSLYVVSECRPCLNHGITALDNKKSKIQAAVTALTGPTGTTNITQGLAWAWRALVPGEPFAEADPNPPDDRQQAIILLTDGENVGGDGDGYKTVFGAQSAARPDMDARLLELAGKIKSSGVLIYTIQFANSGGALQTLMKNVASSTKSPYYHYAPDAATLQSVFKQVANHLSELRLSK